MTPSDHAHDKSGVACNHIVRRKRPVMLIARDADGVWQFMCGKSDHTKAKQAKRVCMPCTFDAFAPGITPEEIPPGHIAERQTRTIWSVREMTTQETEQIEA